MGFGRQRVESCIHEPEGSLFFSSDLAFRDFRGFMCSLIRGVGEKDKPLNTLNSEPSRPCTVPRARRPTWMET